METKNMPDSRLKTLKIARKLMHEGKYRELIENLTSVEGKGTLTPEDKLSFLISIGNIYAQKGQYEDAEKVGELTYQISQKLRRIPESIIALIFKSLIIFLGKIEEGLYFSSFL